MYLFVLKEPEQIEKENKCKLEQCLKNNRIRERTEK